MGDNGETKTRRGVNVPLALGVVLLAWVLLSVFVNDGYVPPLGWLMALVGVVLLGVGLLRRG